MQICTRMPATQSAVSSAEDAAVDNRIQSCSGLRLRVKPDNSLPWNSQMQKERRISEFMQRSERTTSRDQEKLVRVTSAQPCDERHLVGGNSRYVADTAPGFHRKALPCSHRERPLSSQHRSPGARGCSYNTTVLDHSCSQHFVDGIMAASTATASGLLACCPWRP